MTKRFSVVLIIVITGIFIFSIVVGGYWLLQRLAVSNIRHALNYQELNKDIFIQSLHGACRNVNSEKIFIKSSDRRYVHDSHASSSDIYRYIVLEEQILKNTSCLTTLVMAATNVSYSINLVFVDQNGLIVAKFFSQKGVNGE